MRKSFTVAALCLLSASVAWAGPASTVKTRHAVRDELGTLTQYGSGTAIARDEEGFTVLSCAHVVESKGTYGKGKLSVLTPDGREWPARVMAYDSKRDLSLMRVDAPRSKVSVARIASREEYREGLKLLKYGYTGGGDLRVGEGEATQRKSFSNGYRNLIATVRSASGDSGGGVFRKSDGKLIGVVWGGLSDGLRAVRIEDVREFLAQQESTAHLGKGVEP